jgi:ribosome-binding protein aMBF1 (putative translation factor)|uniref:HTH cro/C1-type domain-containing protein n=1 Tax=viral metagenome TaxID=1070528 RepID=A0A6C0BMD6_9ZZZZ
MEHQDLIPVIFHKRKSTQTQSRPLTHETVVEKKKVYPHTGLIPAKLIEQRAEEGQLTLPTVNHQLSLQIQQARQSKKWTQRQLAQKCNLPETIIKDYETGRIIPQTAHLSKMSKMLGTQLKNK